MNETIQSLIGAHFDVSMGQIVSAVAVLVFAFLVNRGLLKLSALLFAQPLRWVRHMRYWIPITRVAVSTGAIFGAVTIVAPPREFLVALMASTGVAVGLAAQELVKDVFGALVIWSDRSYAEGDRVKVGEVEGIVKSIGLRSTRIWAFDDTIVVLPNSRVLSDAVFNANDGQSEEQVLIDLYLPLTTDADRAADMARRAAIGAELVEPTRPVVVLISDELGDRGVALTRIRVKAYVRNVGYEKIFASQVAATAKRLFREAGLYGTPDAPDAPDA